MKQRDPPRRGPFRATPPEKFATLRDVCFAGVPVGVPTREIALTSYTVNFSPRDAGLESHVM